MSTTDGDPTTSTPAPLSLRVFDVHVEYELFEERRAALRQRFAIRTGSGRKVVHAVKGVSFDVREGESVGILWLERIGKVDAALGDRRADRSGLR